MKKYESPELTLVNVHVSDVITTSQPVETEGEEGWDTMWTP